MTAKKFNVLLKIFNLMKGIFNTRKKRVDLIKSEMVSALNRAIQQKEKDAIEEMRSLTEKLKKELFDNKK